MAYTTQSNVADLIDIDVGDDISWAISMANELVEEKCNTSSNAYSTTRLELIERNLAAHFYTTYKPRAKSEKAGSVAETIQGAWDLGFDTSLYGQSAMRLDTGGGLSALNQASKKGIKIKVGATWGGTPLDEETAL